MKQRFSKSRMLLVIETLLRQKQQEWKWRGFPGDLDECTTYAKVEDLGVHAIRLHSRYDTLLGMKYHILNWKLQSEDFLLPEKVGSGDDLEE